MSGTAGMPSSELVEPPVITPSTISQRVQVGTAGMPPSELVEPPVITPSTISRGVQVGTSGTAPVDLASTMENVISIAQSLGLTNIIPTLSDFVSSCTLQLQHSGKDHPKVHKSTSCWDQHYTVLSFLLNGHLHAQYQKLSGMLGHARASPML